MVQLRGEFVWYTKLTKADTRASIRGSRHLLSPLPLPLFLGSKRAVLFTAARPDGVSETPPALPPAHKHVSKALAPEGTRSLLLLGPSPPLEKHVTESAGWHNTGDLTGSLVLEGIMCTRYPDVYMCPKVLCAHSGEMSMVGRDGA